MHLSFHGTLQYLYWTGVHSRTDRWQLSLSLTLTHQEMKCVQVNVMYVPLLFRLYFKINDIQFYSSTHFTYFTENYFNYDFSSLFRRIHHYWICRIQNHHIFFFLRNSNYEFRVSFTIGVLCQTTNVTLMTSVCGIQHKCGSTVLIIPSSPVYNTSISNTWNSVCLLVCFLWRCGPMRTMASSFLRFLDHTQRRITVGRTPLDEWSARRRDLYLTTHNTHNRQISMSPVGFEPTISASEWPQTYALDRAATGTGMWNAVHEIL